MLGIYKNQSNQQFARKFLVYIEKMAKNKNYILLNI